MTEKAPGPPAGLHTPREVAPKSGSKRIFVALLVGCGAITVLGMVLVIALGIWLASGPEGGVKLPNQMDQYALDYLQEHDILDTGEELLAYYDVTVSMDGTEAAILTTERVIYHKKGNNTSIPIGEIEDVRHRQESFLGDVIEVESRSGHTMQIEIAPLNQGETFRNVLMKAWNRATDEAAVEP